MSKRCPDCGFVNEDSRIYCGSCGEPLDAELRLIKSLETQKTVPVKKAVPEDDPQPVSRRRSDGDDDYNIGKMAKEKKSSAAPLVILGLIAAAVIVAVILFS